MGLGRVELPTSPLSGVRSSHLSYRPGPDHHWWSWSESNRRPPECKSGALPAELQPLRFTTPSPWKAPLLSKIESRPVGCRDHESSSWPFGKNSGFPSGDRERTRQPLRKGAGGLEWNDCFLLAAPGTLLRTISETPPTFSLRKEVIQPQVLLRLPCYDFTPIMDHTLGRCLPCGSACRLLVQSTFVM